MNSDPHNRKVFVAGHRGMVGSAIVRELTRRGYNNLILRTSAELDLRNRSDVESFFASNKPEIVVVAAAKVGGIFANNTYPADFIVDNLAIQTNLIATAHSTGVSKLLFLGSSCIYPRLANQPMTEEELLQGSLESTNEAYAIAKIAGIKMCESFNRQHSTDYRSLMPTNLYGPNDNFHIKDSHVIPALMRRLHEAKLSGLESVAIWGTGAARREFLHVDDLAKATAHFLELPKDLLDAATKDQLSHINVGTGIDIDIKSLAEKIAKVVGYKGKLDFDPTMPDGTPRKLLSVERARSLGWSAEIDLDAGLTQTYQWFNENYAEIRTEN